jgi:hypothetical protein
MVRGVEDDRESRMGPGREGDTPGEEPEGRPAQEHERRHDPMHHAGDEEEERIIGTAPSAPDIRKLHLMEPSEEAKAHRPSDVDAMGKDKRREVIGESYGPSRRSQLIFFAIVGIVIVVIIGGWSLAVAAFDKGPGDEDTLPAKAPWSQEDAPQEPSVRPQ